MEKGRKRWVLLTLVQSETWASPSPHYNFAVEQQEVEQLAHLLPPSHWRTTQGGDQASAGINKLGSPTVMPSWSNSVETWVWGLLQGLGVESQWPYWDTRLQNWPRPVMATGSVLKTLPVQSYDVRTKCTNIVAVVCRLCTWDEKLLLPN